MSVTRTDVIPDFRLPSSNGQTLERASFTGKVPLAIVFVPGLDDDASRDQIADFDRSLSEFGSERSHVLVVVPETARRVREVTDERSLTVPILADAGTEMARAFDAAAPDRTVRRVTVLADADGVVLRRFDPAPSDGQAEAVLAALRAAGSGHLEPEQGSVEPQG